MLRMMGAIPLGSTYSCMEWIVKNLTFVIILRLHMQCALGKVYILGGDIVGHCEKGRSHQRVSNSEWLPTQSYCNLQTQKNCKLQTKKEKLLNFNSV